MKNLIVYFSRRGENYCSGSVKELARGNTEVAAEYIQRAVGGDMFEVRTVKEYAKNYYACTREAQDELHSNARPALKEYPESIEGYENIFVGYPNWWGTMPMAMFTFLEHFDWTGKKIIPFCTNEGSGMGSSERDLAKLCRGAIICRGLAVRGTDVARSEKTIANWAKGNV